MISKGWPAPAKLNLILHIIGQREDGNHLLQTVFQLLDYGDFLDFAVRQDGVIGCYLDDAEIVDTDNLIIRAASAIQKESHCPLGVDIKLQKKIFIGGGLGGGSSDAATTLVALNYLWGINFSIERLANIGLTLGADIPFFIHGGSAWAEGIGEQLTVIDLPPAWYLVVQPNCRVSTATIFDSANLQCNTPAITIGEFLKHGGGNDCQSLVSRLYPEVAEALDWLDQFAVAKLTGTGACIFASFEYQQQALSVYNGLPQGWQGFVSKGLNYSPLLIRLKQEKSSQVCHV